jgi:glycosyltransferase involved in cell wall biosynthesis
MSAMFSVIVCTYNPDERILDRALQALLKLDLKGIEAEFIIVDNNSSPPLAERSFMKTFPDKFRIIREPIPGLANARICGVKHATAPTLVFVDDDNEPDPGYLTGLRNVMQQYPQVGIWGPSRIDVDFVDATEDWVKRYMPEKFQYKNGNKTEFGCEAGWPSYYPVGSGIVIQKNIFEKYISLYQAGELTATGRKGNSLASGEDSQIIWTAVKMNIPVGTTPLLKLTHIIPGKRTTLQYLVSLNFNIAYSFYAGQYETFKNESLFHLKPGPATYLKLLLNSIKKTGFNIAAGYKIFLVEKAWYEGYLKFFNEKSSR